MMHYDAFKELCEQRRSVRYFDDKPVAKEDILKLLELARLSPSVENTQPWHFHVILNKELRHKLTEMCFYGNFIGGAGAFIVVTCDQSLQMKAAEPVWNIRELECSCMAAMTHMLLGATAMGIGSCWVSLLHGNVQELLKVPLKEIIVGGIMLGHFKKGEEKGNAEHQRKPLETMYTIHE